MYLLFFPCHWTPEVHTIITAWFLPVHYLGFTSSEAFIPASSAHISQSVQPIVDYHMNVFSTNVWNQCIQPPPQSLLCLNSSLGIFTHTSACTHTQTCTCPHTDCNRYILCYKSFFSCYHPWVVTDLISQLISTQTCRVGVGVCLTLEPCVVCAYADCWQTVTHNLISQLRCVSVCGCQQSKIY